MCALSHSISPRRLDAWLVKYRVQRIFPATTLTHLGRAPNDEVVRVQCLAHLTRSQGGENPPQRRLTGTTLSL